MAGERAVAVVPHGAEGRKGSDGKPMPYASTHLIFADDGKLAERRIVDNVFDNNEWKIKPLMKQIVMSATYRQTSNASKELRERDFIAPHGESPGALSEDLGTQRIADETLGLRKLLLNCASSAEEVEYRPTALSR